MAFRQNPKLRRLLKPFGRIETSHRYDDVRIHHVVWSVLYRGEANLRQRYPGSGIASDDFIGPAIVELDRRRLIYKVEARVYVPMFIRPEHIELARAQEGSPIWLPSIRLEKQIDEIWKEVCPRLKRQKVVWS